MKNTAIKICGVRDAATVEVAARAGADFIGVVLVESSPRAVTPADAMELARAITGEGATAVAVVRFPLSSEVLRALPHFRIVQCHGTETLEDVTAFESRASGQQLWKGLHFSMETTERWLASGAVSRLVVDGPDAGSGVAFDHGVFATLNADLRARCLLAGGLNATNVRSAISIAQPGGVDVSSGVESARGVKDHAMIRAFIEAARSA